MRFHVHMSCVRGVVPAAVGFWSTDVLIAAFNGSYAEFTLMPCSYTLGVCRLLKKAGRM